MIVQCHFTKRREVERKYHRCMKELAGHFMLLRFTGFIGKDGEYHS